MIHSVRLKKIGGSVAAIIPKEVLQRQHLEANDEVFVVETADGILLTASDPETKAALEAFTEGAKLNRDAMAALSKL
jgi:antitoxin component of MazEF toxin-antitoxin module